MLTLAQSRAGEINRLRVAIAHLDAAITQINNVRQAGVPRERGQDGLARDELGLLVTALGDIREALQRKV